MDETRIETVLGAVALMLVSAVLLLPVMWWFA